MNDNQKLSKEKKFEAMLQLAEFGAKRIEGRRSTEFKMFLSYMTLLVLALYQLIKQTASIDLEPWEGIALYFLALFIHIIYVMWQVGLTIAMRNDERRRNLFLKEAEEAPGVSLDYTVGSKEIVIVNPYWKQFRHLEAICEHWSPPFLIGIPTILFSILIYLSIQEFFENIRDFYHIPLSGFPLLFLVIPPIVWFFKKNRKKEFEFYTFMPMGVKEAKARKGTAADVIFKTYSNGVNTSRDAWVYNFNQTYSNGVNTSRDAWVYNFNRNVLIENMRSMIETYNGEIDRCKRKKTQKFDEKKIIWSETLKHSCQRGKTADFSQKKVRKSLYRPFTKSNLYFDRIMTERLYKFPFIFPNPETENWVICASSPGPNAAFHVLIGNVIPDYHLTGDSQCFPFYTYDKDGAKRKENITDWALTQFRTHYNDAFISKWDIFHYTYGLLHHPDYREKYQANLKRNLPHIPFAEDFYGFADAGAELAKLHVNYESAPKYDGLRYIVPGASIDWRVEKMKLSKNKMQLVYNDSLTIAGIPVEVYDYRLGTRSALEWVIDQYRVKLDERSGIVNDPNRADAPRYIVDLIARVIHVSLKTVEIVAGLPELPT